jgi:hypothetical protein
MEFARKVRVFEKVHLMKMRESRLAIEVAMPALLCVPRIQEPLGEAKCKLLLKLIFAIRLIGGHTHNKPKGKHDIDDAERYFEDYVRGSIELYGLKFAKYTNHSLIHLAEDARNFSTHLGGLSAYIAENFQQVLFRGVSFII